MATSTTSHPPKNFLNEPVNSVSEFIAGLLLQYPNKLRKLANHNVLLSSKITFDKVNILSGGGSGHEPSHAGWIASHGMLTGAILGGIFASPSVSSILAAIRAVTIPHSTVGGCLLIVKNYTGDRLNFGMACELANAEGRKCQMVIVADDCALPRSKGITGARGVAGTVFVHKVAGAAADKGMSLHDVMNVARNVASRIGTLGVALNSVTIPGSSTVNDRLAANMMEIGLGIHGEAGLTQSTLKSADDIAGIVLKTILDYGRIDTSTGDVVPLCQAGSDIAVMINNLGGTSNFEMSILANSVVKLLEEDSSIGPFVVTRLYVGSFMTSFDMKGASVSIMPLSENTELPSLSICELLDADTDALAWSKADIWKVEENHPRPSQTLVDVEAADDKLQASSLVERYREINIYDFSNIAKMFIKVACNTLVEAEPILTKYDTIVGDGDCGLTMKRGAIEILSRLVAEEEGSNNEKIITKHPVPLFKSIADAISSSMGGTSGILLELMFRKMSTFLNESKEDITSKSICFAFKEGVKAISFYGGASLGSRTMLDALIPAVENLCSENGNLKTASLAAMTGAEATASMRCATAGRSNYLSEDVLMGTSDPGAMAVALILKSIAEL